jgi:hypothetical protein
MADQKSNSGASKVRATIRVRPFNPGDRPQQQCVFVKAEDNGTVELVDPRIKNSACQVFKFVSAGFFFRCSCFWFAFTAQPNFFKLFSLTNNRYCE